MMADLKDYKGTKFPIKKWKDVWFRSNRYALCSFFSPSWFLIPTNPKATFHSLLTVSIPVIYALPSRSPQCFQSIQPTSLLMEQHWQLWCTTSDLLERKQREGFWDSVYRVFSSVRYCPEPPPSLTTYSLTHPE